MNRFKKGAKKSSLKTIWFLLSLVLLLVFLGGFYLAQKRWKVKTKFNLLISLPEKLLLLSLSPQQNVAFLVEFPGELKLRAYGGYGLFKINKLPALSRQEGKKNLVKSSLEHNFGLPFDFLLFSPDDDLGLDMGVENKNLLRQLLTKGSIEIVDRLNLWQVLRKLKRSTFVYQEISALDMGFVLNDSQDGYQLNYQNWDSWSRIYLTDYDIVEENFSLSILNAGSTDGSASNISRVLSNSGFSVELIDKSKEEKNGCLIVIADETIKESRSLKRLTQILPDCTLEINSSDGLFEIVIFLGKGFLGTI